MGMASSAHLHPSPKLPRHLHISAPHGQLEANLREASGPVRGVAVLCHPHPLHGGTMHTKAVFRTAQALAEAGFHVLRFNFRGVGTSTGSYDDGVGEMDDARAAVAWLQERHPSLPLLLGGFSFGSRVALRVGVEDGDVAALLGLGLAPDLFDYGFLDGVGRPVLLVQGEEDRFGSGERVARMVEELNGPITLVRVAGSDHFFHDHFEELQRAVREYFSRGAGAEPFGTAPD